MYLIKTSSSVSRGFFRLEKEIQEQKVLDHERQVVELVYVNVNQQEQQAVVDRLLAVVQVQVCGGFIPKTLQVLKLALFLFL